MQNTQRTSVMSALPLERIPIRLSGLKSPVEIAVRRNGFSSSVSSRPPALLLHGLGLSSYSWRYVQQGLDDCRKTLAVDLLGFGRSGKPSGADYSLPGLARSVLALMDALEIERTALVGHSLGGGVALLAAAMQPERVESLALFGSVAYPQPEPPFVTIPRLPLVWLPMMLFPRLFIKEGLLQVYMKPGSLTPDALQEYAAPYTSFSGATAYQRICRALRPAELGRYIEKFQALSMPVLIVHGDRDNVVPLWVPERLHQEIPHSSYHLLNGVGHMLVEEEPEILVDLLRPLLCGEEL
jgi:pimeloyl-ACP methyl ester carboxylesterase